VCARATRKKSLRPSKSAPASFSAHEEVELQACPKGTPEGGAAGLREWPISEHRELSCQERSSRAQAPEAKLSLHFELMADACPLPLSPNWLKSSVKRLSEN
jgi:hypothetical protein